MTGFRGRAAVQEFQAAGIRMPDEVTDLHERLIALNAAQPAEPRPRDLAELIADAAPAADIDAALAYAASYALRRNGWAQAAEILSDRILAGIYAARDDLHAQLKAQADKAIETITRAANLPTVTELVRTGRHADAETVVNAEAATATYEAMRNLRDLYLTGGQPTRVNGWDASVWRDERAVDSRIHGATSPFDHLRQGIDAGGALWFPTAAEARARAATISAEEAARQREAEAAKRGIGGLAAFG